jgi:SpoVK/Ycf46/Vps4 family AAA+-type ATPase
MQQGEGRKAMNASLMKRLFRAVSNGDQHDLYKIAQLIIEDEEKKGHHQLADDLKKTLKPLEEKRSDNVFPMPNHALKALPMSKRHDSPLAAFYYPHELQHEMILPADVEKRFARIEKEYAARDRLALYGLKPRKKILMYGPPGCGKTLGAQRLAWNTGLPLMKVRFDAVVSSYLGETAFNLRTIFETAGKAPVVLFFDECDSIAQSRNVSQEVGEIKRVVNSFLQFLDEYDAPGLLVAATNLTDDLDPAVWRRFDDFFEIPKPGPQELKKIVQMTLSAMQTDNFDWKEIIELSKGFSAAQMVRAAQDAAKQAVLDSREHVRHEDLKQAIMEIKGVAYV